MLILGAHMSIAGGFSNAPKKAGEELHSNAMQIFTKSPRGGNVKPLDPGDVAEFQALCKQYGIKYVVAHSAYLLNFAKPIKNLPWMRESILSDFQRLHELGGHGVVVHIGKALDGERSIGIHHVIENAKYVVDATQKEGLDYILENTAGQGSEIGFQLEELAQVWKGLQGFSPRIKHCLDTAHIWAAGYDIGTASGARLLLKEYDELIGIKDLACIHFNDSKKAKGARLDRHENIGDGQIGLEGLKTIAKFAAENSTPLILETPEIGGKSHIDDVKVVRGWFGAVKKI
jgi:deoxyribonuclease-4